MNDQELAKRQERVRSEQLVIREVEHGFQVYATANPRRTFLVAGTEEAPTCTCPDFRSHASDPEWRCKHVLAVEQHFGNGNGAACGNGTDNPSAAGNGRGSYSGSDPVAAEERRAIQEEGRGARLHEGASRGNGRSPSPNGAVQMQLKRSVSPDGRIDSLSVEFSTRLDDLSADDAEDQAGEMLALQAGIIEQFLNGNGTRSTNGSRNGHGSRQGYDAATSDRQDQTESPAVPARLVDVAGMNGKWGRRLFLNVEVDGRTLKCFGRREELAQHVITAGYPGLADRLNEGTVLNLPCRAITKPSPDGRYLNVERILPANSDRSWGR